MTKVKRVSITVTADAVSEKPVSFFFVCDSLFVLVVTLKTNCLFIARKVLSQKDCFFRNIDHVFEQRGDFVVGVCIS